MKVMQMIEELQQIEDKDQEVYAWDDGERIPIEMIDDSIDGAVDLNLQYAGGGLNVPFVEEVFEIAFGDDALNKGYSHDDVLHRLREFSDNALKHEESSEAKVKSEEIHWELGIDMGEDEGTETIDVFDDLSDALRALRNTDNETAFVDMWVGSNHIGQEIKKRDL